MGVQPIRVLVGMWLLLAALACNTVIQSPPDPEPQASLRGTSAQAPPPVPSPLDLATRAVQAARARAEARASRRHPAATTLAHDVRRQCEVMVHQRELDFVPELREAATRRVHLAINVGAIQTAWPVDGAEVPPKVKESALRRKRRIKPGELAFVYAKGGGTLRVQLFDASGRMRPEAYIAICKGLYEPQKETPVIEHPWVAYDPRLLTLMYYAGQHFDRPIEVVSAYRSHKGRATSNHSLGHAMDISIDKEKRRVVMAYFERSFSQIGVGWYPRSTFIHVDTRERSYYWTDASAPGKPQRNRERKIVLKPRPGSDPTAHTVHVPQAMLYR